MKVNIFARKYYRDEDSCGALIYQGGDFKGEIIADSLGIYFQEEYITEWGRCNEVSDYTVQKHMRDAARIALDCVKPNREQELESRIEQLMGMLEVALTSRGGSTDAHLNWSRPIPQTKAASTQQKEGGAIAQEYRTLGITPSDHCLKPSEIKQRVQKSLLVPPPN